MIKKILLLTLTIGIPACGGSSNNNTASPSIGPVVSNLSEFDMTGVWLSENKSVYTRKNDGRILEETTRTFQIYIEDTVSGIRDIICPHQVIDPEVIVYTGSKTDFEYYPDDVIAQPYLLKDGALVQKYEVDEVWGGEDTIKSNYNTLTYLDSKESVYTEGVIVLSETIDINQTTEICTLYVKQKFFGSSETDTYSFFIPYGSGDLDYLTLFISLVGNPVAGRYDLGASYLETGFRKIYINSITPEFIDLAGDSLIFGDSGWIDLISISEGNFESEFSIALEDGSLYTGYINVNVSDLVQ